MDSLARYRGLFEIALFFFSEPVDVLIANHSYLLFNLLDTALTLPILSISHCVCDRKRDLKVAIIFFKNNFLEVNLLN